MAPHLEHPEPFRRALLVGLALTLFASTSPVWSQDRSRPPEFSEEITVSEVLLDVLVTDRDGGVVLGLKPDDFVVEEDGQRVPVRDLTFYSSSRFVGSAEGAREKGLSLDRIPVDRYFILFFHDQRLGAPRIVQAERQQLDAGRKAQDWVREEMLPTDWVAVASYDTQLKIHQDFTHDKGALLAALEDAPLGRHPRGAWASRVEREPRDDRPSLLAHVPTGKQLGKETRTIYDGLHLLAQAAGHTVGRKNLVLFSRGFGDLSPGGVYQPDPRYYDDMERALNDNNVAVYTLDLVPSDVDHTFASALGQLAEETGGRYYFNFVSFLTPLRQVAENNSGYYLLSYESRKPAGESGFQRVEVSLRNPSFEVRARKGYLYGEDAGR
jgi:VWFA-related protein